VSRHFLKKIQMQELRGCHTNRTFYAMEPRLSAAAWYVIELLHKKIHIVLFCAKALAAATLPEAE